MEIPDTVDTCLTPLAPSLLADRKLLPSNLSRQFDSVLDHFRNNSGNIVLFTGASAFAFTAAANLLGERAGRDVYHVDLTKIVSEYIGETEKNLLQVFELAEKRRYILLFDEADSLFGKRTEVCDSHDDFATVEVSYLLKRFEDYPELVIITTNAREQIDEALLKATSWQINLNHPVLHRRLPWWQRFINWFRKR